MHGSMHLHVLFLSLSTLSWSSLGTKLRASLGTGRAGYISWDPGRARLQCKIVVAYLHKYILHALLLLFFLSRSLALSVQTNWSERTPLQDARQQMMDRFFHLLGSICFV
jgi:hypothetical protein